MGAGYHGGFGDTVGSRNPDLGETRGGPLARDEDTRIFKPVQYVGTVKVDGIERDVSRRVYQRNDIDFDRIDPDTGETNLQRMLKGNAPIGRDGKPIELHHILQKEVGPMVEIHEMTHREYKKILHGIISDGDSFRNDKTLDSQYRNFKRAYWKWRANGYLEANKSGGFRK